MSERGIKPGGGAYKVVIPVEERQVLAALSGQLLDALDADEPTLYRLFQPAYTDDAKANREYRELVGRSLKEGKRAALTALKRTADATRLTGEELETWLGAVESLRLALGTQLNVNEESHGPIDPDDPDAPRRALFQWLSWLQEEIVEALTTSLPSRENSRP
ncbi:MAG: DUF2017 family protein [Thermoleophilia bacterium]|nr:DUF2017 family protein [Thermoleophilia bacterium]